MEKEHILVVDDDESIRSMLKDNLVRSGYRVSEAADGEQAINLFYEDRSIQLILLDVMMPKMDGWEVLDEIREVSDIPVIMLTANGKEADQLKGFHRGADDYLPKPVSIMLILAHVQAILKRSVDQRTVYQFDVRIEVEERALYVGDEEKSLTPKEYELLLFFAQNENIILSRETLLNRVWGYSYLGDTRTLDTHVKQLRKKLGDEHNFIRTVHGHGYQFTTRQ